MERVFGVTVVAYYYSVEKRVGNKEMIISQ